jgi:hypothetical protein
VQGQAPQVIALPRPGSGSAVPMMTALSFRARLREFAPAPLPARTLGALLPGANGVNRPVTGRRTAPAGYGSNWIAGDVEGIARSLRSLGDYAALLDMNERYFLDAIRVIFQEQWLARGTWRIGARLVPRRRFPPSRCARLRATATTSPAPGKLTPPTHCAAQCPGPGGRRSRLLTAITMGFLAEGGGATLFIRRLRNSGTRCRYPDRFRVQFDELLNRDVGIRAHRPD